MLSVAAKLQSQATLTAVERFAKLHDEGLPPQQSQYYRDLIPLERPRSGEQYAFEVDLDALHGVQGVRHRLPHLERARRRTRCWRSVGLLHGGTRGRAGAADGHDGMPPLRGPGLHERLPGRRLREGRGHRHRQAPRRPMLRLPVLHAHVPLRRAEVQRTREASSASATCAATASRRGEAPACVQACPNEAIAIRIVIASGRDRAARGAAPSCRARPIPSIHVPTTVYKTEKAMPAQHAAGRLLPHAPRALALRRWSSCSR